MIMYCTLNKVQPPRTADEIAAAGMRPVVNSHYARQLQMWSIPMALSGQQYDAREGGVLRFNRRDRSMRRWPLLTPQALGVVSLSESSCSGGLALRVVTGSLIVQELWLEGTLVGTNVRVASDVHSKSSLCLQLESSYSQGARNHTS